MHITLEHCIFNCTSSVKVYLWAHNWGDKVYLQSNAINEFSLSSTHITTIFFSLDDMFAMTTPIFRSTVLKACMCGLLYPSTNHSCIHSVRIIKDQLTTNIFPMKSWCLTNNPLFLNTCIYQQMFPLTKSMRKLHWKLSIHLFVHPTEKRILQDFTLSCILSSAFRLQ